MRRLENGRTVHSLIKTMLRYPGNRFVLISTSELGLPQYVKDALDAAGCPYEELPSLREAMPKLDVLYMTRIQKERFSSPGGVRGAEGRFCARHQKAQPRKARSQGAASAAARRRNHRRGRRRPPRHLLEQTEYGMYARMALVLLMLEHADRRLPPRATADSCASLQKFPLHHPVRALSAPKIYRGG